MGGQSSALGATFDRVDVSIVGNQISLFGTLKAMPSGSNLLAVTTVDLGMFPEGRQVVRYSAHGEEGTDSGHDASLSFGDGCPSGSRRLYRLYNGRPDVNDRYTISKVVRDAMRAQGGWILEGSARLSAYPAGQLIDTVAMCVPNQEAQAASR